MPLATILSPALHEMAYNQARKSVPQFRPKAMLERSAKADLFRNTLSKIPTVFGQLGYLAALRDPDSGVYRHHGLAEIFGRDESRRALAETHERVFRQWLNLSLSKKMDDLLEYLAARTDPKPAVLKHWARNQTYRSYLPESTRESDRQLFFQEFEVLLETLTCGNGG
jgi:hypothetical protein